MVNGDLNFFFLLPVLEILYPGSCIIFEEWSFSGTKLVCFCCFSMLISCFYFAGTSFLCSVLIAPVRNEEGIAVMYIVNHEDVTWSPNRDEVTLPSMRQILFVALVVLGVGMGVGLGWGIGVGKGGGWVTGCNNIFMRSHLQK